MTLPTYYLPSDETSILCLRCGHCSHGILDRDHLQCPSCGAHAGDPLDHFPKPGEIVAGGLVMAHHLGGHLALAGKGTIFQDQLSVEQLVVTIDPPETVWTIKHNLGGPVIVEMFDLLGNPLPIWAAELITLPDKDTAIVQFAEPMAGQARLIATERRAWKATPVFASKENAPPEWAKRGVELFDPTAQSGYILQRRLPDGRYICLMPIMFEGVQLTLGPDLRTWQDGYWFDDAAIGLIAALTWDPAEQSDPGMGWKRHIGEGGVDEHPDWYREQHPEQFDENGEPLG